MAAMRNSRAAALLAAGVLAVHELRYLAGYGEQAGAASAAHGHGYLALAGALVAALLVAACARFALALLRAHQGDRPGQRAPRFLVAWAASTAVLLAAYGLQESLEAMLHPGHPAGLAAVLGHGGWTAFLLALGLGALVALLLCGASRAIEQAESQRSAPPSPRPRAAAPAGLRPGFRAPAPPLARHLAGRAPPTLSSV